MAGGIRPRRRGLVVLSSGAGLLAVGGLATGVAVIASRGPTCAAPACAGAG